MDNAKGTMPRGPHRAVFNVMRPIVHVLRASGYAEAEIHAATGAACQLYPCGGRGIALDGARFAELAGVVRLWARDPDFLDETGVPSRLSLGDGAPSFRALLQKSTCTDPTRALAQLQGLGAVRLCERGRRVRLVSSFLPPATDKGFVVAPTLDSIRRFAETVEHDLFGAPDPAGRRAHRFVSLATVDRTRLWELWRFVLTSAESLLEAADEKLHGCAAPDAKGGGVTCGVGLYFFVDEPHALLEAPRTSRGRRMARGRRVIRDSRTPRGRRGARRPK